MITWSDDKIIVSIIHSLPSQCHLDERFLPELSQRAEHRRVPQIPLLLHCLKTVSPRPPLIPSCSDGPSYYCCQWWRTRMDFQLPYWDPEGYRHVWLFVTPCAVATTLLCPWNFSDKNIGVDWYFPLNIPRPRDRTWVSCAAGNLLHYRGIL